MAPSPYKQLLKEVVETLGALFSHWQDIGWRNRTHFLNTWREFTPPQTGPADMLTQVRIASLDAEPAEALRQNLAARLSEFRTPALDISVRVSGTKPRPPMRRESRQGSEAGDAAAAEEDDAGPPPLVADDDDDDRDGDDVLGQSFLSRLSGRSPEEQLRLLLQLLGSERHHRTCTSKDTIENLPKILVTEERLKELEVKNHDTCAICQDTFSVGDSITTMPGCGHIFHHHESDNCGGIVTWLQRANTCPTCKHTLPTEPPRTCVSVHSSEGGEAGPRGLPALTSLMAEHRNHGWRCFNCGFTAPFTDRIHSSCPSCRVARNVEGRWNQDRWFFRRIAATVFRMRAGEDTSEEEARILTSSTMSDLEGSNWMVSLATRRLFDEARRLMESEAESQTIDATAIFQSIDRNSGALVVQVVRMINDYNFQEVQDLLQHPDANREIPSTLARNETLATLRRQVQELGVETDWTDRIATLLAQESSQASAGGAASAAEWAKFDEVLDNLESRGWRVRHAVQLLRVKVRDLLLLTEGTDSSSAVVVRFLLRLVEIREQRVQHPRRSGIEGETDQGQDVSSSDVRPSSRRSHNGRPSSRAGSWAASRRGVGNVPSQNFGRDSANSARSMNSTAIHGSSGTFNANELDHVSGSLPSMHPPRDAIAAGWLQAARQGTQQEMHRREQRKQCWEQQQERRRERREHGRQQQEVVTQTHGQQSEDDLMQNSNEFRQQLHFQQWHQHYRAHLPDPFTPILVGALPPASGLHQCMVAPGIHPMTMPPPMLPMPPVPPAPHGRNRVCSNCHSHHFSHDPICFRCRCSDASRSQPVGDSQATADDNEPSNTTPVSTSRKRTKLQCSSPGCSSVFWSSYKGRSPLCRYCRASSSAPHTAPAPPSSS